MEKETTSLRQKIINVLQEQNRSLTFRELTNAIWATYPEYKNYLIAKYQTEQQARIQQRTRLGIAVKDNNKLFTVTKSENQIFVGLSAELFVSLQSDDDEESLRSTRECVYWYTFPTYKKEFVAYPILISRGNVDRFGQWHIEAPELPELLGTYEHSQPHLIEKALHSVLELKGRRVKDVASEWFVTTPQEITELLDLFSKLTLNESAKLGL